MINKAGRIALAGSLARVHPGPVPIYANPDDFNRLTWRLQELLVGETDFIYCQGCLDEIVRIKGGKKSELRVDVLHYVFAECCRVERRLLLQLLDLVEKLRCRWGRRLLAGLTMGVRQECMALTDWRMLR